METTSSLLKSVSRMVYTPPQRPFKVCSHDRGVRKGVTAATLQQLKEKVAEVLMLSSLLSLVCEEDGTEVDSEEFLTALPDNSVFIGLEPGQTWTPQATVQRSNGGKPSDCKPRKGQDIARVVLDFYRISPHDLFGSLSVMATFQGLYSVGADFQLLGPKKLLKETLRLASMLLQGAGHMLITCASMMKRIIEGADLLQTQRGPVTYRAQWD
ncbi:cell death activator CIDE-B isoform X2 [Clupea harengus]|uniref:Cell death activator CIDE-B isoform X2 n=1 Tax=Clupea harengus TaxID=7950 RepID=A0A6P3VMS1_CLUHA|nr:cell death activator CIDE-B isoform X2 [Clupea harengus]